MGANYTVFLPMRGGSKGIKDKNITAVAGRPLCHWVLHAVQACEAVSRIVVSTDSDAIAASVHDFSSDIIVLDRPAALATDAAKADDSLRYHITHDETAFDDAIIFVQATSPLLETKSLTQACQLFEAEGYDSLFSASRIYQFLWHEDGTPMNYDPAARPNRQDHAGQLYETGGFYVFNKQGFVDHSSRLFGNVGYCEVAPHTTFEVDDPEDLLVVEALLTNRLKKA